MKTSILFLLLVVMSVPVALGQIKIGDNPQNIDAASVLELESSSRVLVITRVSTAEMEAIVPQRGGLVYNTDTECIHYHDGSQWINLCDAVSFSLTNDPVENTNSTISILDNGSTINLEVTQNSIRSENIVDGTINGQDIQANSIGINQIGRDAIGTDELADNSIGSLEIVDNSLRPEDLAATAPAQVLTTDENGIPQWEDVSNLTTEVSLEIAENAMDIAVHINEDEDTVIGNESLASAVMDGDELVLTESGSETRVNLSDFATDTALTTGLALKENLSNKSDNITLGNSATLYPTQRAVKLYVDNTVGGSAQTIVSEDANNSITASLVDGGAFYDDSSLTAATAANATAITTNTTAITDKEDTANKSSDVTLADGTNTLFPTELAVKTYVDTQVGAITAPTIVSADAGNVISPSTADGGAFYDDSSLTVATAANATAITTNTTAITDKEDTANKSSDVTLADGTNTLFPTELAVKTYVDTQVSTITAGNNLENSNLILPASTNRTFSIDDTSNLIFTGLGNVGIGNGANPPQNKLHVAGAARVEAILNSSAGSAGEPTYRFNGDTNTGMFRDAADELVLVAGSIEGIRIDESDDQTQTSIQGSFSTPINRVDTNITLDKSHHTVILTSGVTTITLPPSDNTNLGRIYILKNIAGTPINISPYVNADGSNLSETVLPVGVLQLQSDGTNWQQIN